MKKTKFQNNKEPNTYEKLALPFQRRLYRTALILTKSSNLAEMLVIETNNNARKLYHQHNSDKNSNIGVLLFQLLMKNFATD